MTIYKDTCATKDMADSNFIANHATLGNYVHEKEITLLDYNIGMARTEMTELFPPRSSYRPGFFICLTSLIHIRLNHSYLSFKFGQSNLGTVRVRVYVNKGYGPQLTDDHSAHSLLTSLTVP